MSGAKWLACAGVCLLIMVGNGSFANSQEVSSGSQATTDRNDVSLWAWVEVELVATTAATPSGGATPKDTCHYRQGNLLQLLTWLQVDLGVLKNDHKIYLFKFCQNGLTKELMKYWVYTPKAPKQGSPQLGSNITRKRQEVWGGLAIPEPTILMAPPRITIVHIPTFVWVPQAQKLPVSATITTTLEGNEITLHATAKPRSRGFLRVDMGDGKRLWCDKNEVVPFNIDYDPFDQLSKCVYFYRRSSVSADDLRYKVELATYWEVSLRCELNSKPCPGPLPVVPTQVLTAEPHLIGVAEIQALAGQGSAI